MVFLSMAMAEISTPASNKLRSLFLPGLGEYSMGHEKLAKSFFIREAALWFVCLGGMKVSNWYENDYKAFAAIHADINLDQKSYIFAVNVGHFDSFSDYNANRARKRQNNEMYEEGQGNEWEWDSVQNRIEYDRMRIYSVNYNKYAQFAIGGLVLHRIISLFDVVYLENKFTNASLVPEFTTDSASLTFKILLDL